jgi:hypothetical protein
VAEKEGPEKQPSCDPKLTRSEFLRQVVQKAKFSGTLVAGAIIADYFVAPPRVAAAS